MYLSEILFYMGMLCISISISAAIVWLAAIFFLYFICRHEEKLLLEMFGDKYRKYMDTVPMWLPKFRLRKKR